jgi:hypothetical protein
VGVFRGGQRGFDKVDGMAKVGEGYRRRGPSGDERAGFLGEESESRK